MQSPGRKAGALMLAESRCLEGKDAKPTGILHLAVALEAQPFQGADANYAPCGF
jgi:hypothetical protein